MLQSLKPYRGGLAVVAIGIIAFFIFRGNPINDFKLITRGVLVHGIATDVSDFEDQEDNAIVKRYFFIKYEFITATGEAIKDIVEVQGKSTDKGFATGQAIEIQYLPETPGIHRVKALASTSISGWIISNLLFGLLAIAPGCYFIFHTYRSKEKAG
jgi:hypothetical protein